MACYLNENVYIHTFTPREYQVELLDSAKKRNTIVCTNTSSSKAFLVLKLLQELSWKMRQSNGKKALLILDPQNVETMASHISFLTDLKVVSMDKLNFLNKGDFLNYNVFVTTADMCMDVMTSQYFDLGSINLIVIDDYLYGQKQNTIKSIMSLCTCFENYNQLRILGLTTGLLGHDLQLHRLEAEFHRLEKLLDSSVDTSSEIVTLIRLSCSPKESIIECPKPSKPLDLHTEMKDIILECKNFLLEHRYDPSEIYDDELLEEFKLIPDPKIQPLELLNNFLEILEDLGPYCADKAAFSLLSKIEKLKVKVPYERHYLLLCLVSTTLIKVRSLCDYEFEKVTDLEKIMKFSTPKVLKLLEVLKQFKPAGEKPEVVEKPEVEQPQQEFRFRKGYRGPKKPYIPRQQPDDMLCALVFVNNRFTAKALHGLLYSISQCDDNFWWILCLFSVDKIADPSREPREAEQEHKVQEEVLRKFRAHDCNILITTSILEHGCDLPKCNLVLRFDLPQTFHSYIQCKARARANDAHYILFGNQHEVTDFVASLAEYNEVENTLLKRCCSLEPDIEEKNLADAYSRFCPKYQPLAEPGSPYVNLNNSIPLVNKYCAKLPSDTFTKLTPIWREEMVNNKFVCHIRLPINSPVKKTISSPPMVNALLARMVAAFMLCQQLHLAGELDDNLQPIGKENFKATDDDWNNFILDEPDDETAEIRPGTTKRRQYYYKKIADRLLECLPVVGEKSYFYTITMNLTCPLPEEQNTRGRKIYPPEESPQGFGIITSKAIPIISPFPIFTRSGEVSVDLELCTECLVLNKEQMMKIREFVNYTFTSVLRLQKYLMLFNPADSSNNYLIVPTIRENNKILVDWKFLEMVYSQLHVLPEFIPDEDRKDYKFDPEIYADAVVMPWYRNQDQPQYFYVAQICTYLKPESAFPGSEYATFEEYYQRKYDIQIQNSEQNLLDVDHTSARLNFLTPRYVNRKGVALPTSSEETKRAKRENLEQKQILVPELCAIHPFPASLWRKAVCLPCILYRINALLVADQIRRNVANELNLGKPEPKKGFKWPSLNFGWNLADVLKKSKEDELRKLELKCFELNLDELCKTNLKITELDDDMSDIDSIEESEEELEGEKSSEKSDTGMEIGTWSNDMADQAEHLNSNAMVRYSSPTNWMQSHYDDFSDSDESYTDDSDSEIGGLRIEFTSDNVAEALDDCSDSNSDFHLFDNDNAWKIDEDCEKSEMLVKQFYESCAKNREHILNSGILIPSNVTFQRKPNEKLTNNINLEIDIDSSYFKDVFIKYEKADVYTIIPFKEIKNDYDISEPLKLSFDMQPDLVDHPGPSPNIILQALTMSNANDGINLERLETIGDSFLKYAITNYLYSKYEHVHEGKLSHLRSKQVSNLNLYRLGKRKNLGDYMIATKFDPHDNWLPPCFYVPKKLEEALFEAQFPANCWTVADMAATRDMSIDEICEMVRERGENVRFPAIIPYNLITQHSIPDKSIADCVEAMIGAYLIECGPRGALLFMAWLGIRVLPELPDGTYGEILKPHSPLLRYVSNPEDELERLLDGYEAFEKRIGYKFNDRSYLLQALTHASYSPNQLTDCYQRLEFLGDAVLDYLITRHLYEDHRMHSPGALTDLRSALVNNTIFASLAVRFGFHKYFRHLSPGLNEVVEKFIRLQEESGHTLVDELYLVMETECEEVEDVEVPKALGDVFESVAGAIFLDSGMSLDAVWKVYYKMMKNEIEQFSNKVPKSPIRELLELEPETAKFGKPEKLADGRRVRVTVEVFGKGIFKGIGRNYRIAKCTAAKCALKYLKKRGLTIKKL